MTSANARDQDITWLANLVAGLGLGFAVTLALAVVYFLAVPVAVVLVTTLALRMRHRTAFAGGVLVGMSSWFIYLLADSERRCREVNLQPNASCQSFGAQDNAIAMILLLLVGLGLVTMSVARARAYFFGKRSLRGGE
jgi:hypothetical protein